METTDNYRQPPTIIRDPGPEYRAAPRAFQGISSIACGRDGRLWAVWYGGITPGEDHNNVVMLAVSTDNGRTWREKLVIDPDGEGPVRAFDPEIWRDPNGKLWLFWAQHAVENRNSTCGVWAMIATETDGPDTVWSAPRRLCDGVMMCKPTVLSTGEWALPVSFWGRRESGSAGMVVSSDHGATWTERGACDVHPDVRSFDEHMLVERIDGSLWMLVRTSNGIGESVSTDGGCTWSALTPSTIPHVDSRFFVRRLISGRLLLVRHDPANGDFANDKSRGTRSHLTAFLSDDDGRNWTGGLLLDERSGVSYPDGDQATDGSLIMTYDYDRKGAREILMAAFTEADITANSAASTTVRRRVRINKAGPQDGDDRGDPSAECPRFEISPPDPPNDGILFVEHAQTGRSGHLGHALVEYEPGKILAFYANCSDANKGHTGDGWMEVRRSEDGGANWSAPTPLDYSKQVYDAGEGRSVMCEKAVRTNDGTILLFNLECANIPEKNFTWQPLAVPTVIRSTDCGCTWGQALPVGDEPGRIWDAFYHEGTVYVLELYNDSSIKWYGNQPQHHYSLYVSTDQGRSFARRSVLPFDIMGRGYGTLATLPEGGLIAYVYNQNDENRLDYVVSNDGGHTWSSPHTVFMAKQIRNPQIAAFRGGYVLHGRSGHMGADAIKGHLVLYTSPDGLHWDAGRYLQMRTTGLGAYSNNLLVHDPAGKAPARLLIQSSHAYEQSKTNIHHWWLV